MNKVLMYRSACKLTQEDMAMALGISITAYRQKESGEREFRNSEMVAFTNKLKEYDSNITMDDIFFN